MKKKISGFCLLIAAFLFVPETLAQSRTKRPLQKKQTASNQVTQEERYSLLRLISQRESLGSQISDYGGFETVAQKMEVQKIYNKNGTNLYLVSWVMGSSLCGSSGECQSWVLERANDNYSLLLSEYGLSFLATSTNQYRDLSQSFGASTSRSDYYYGAVFKFQNGKYLKSCFKRKRTGGKSIKVSCD